MAVDTSTVQVVMPAMGDSVAEGTVLEWHKQEGDPVADGETIVEISTDKVDAEVPAPVSGTVLRRHVAEGDTVAVGALLAEITPGSPQTNGGAKPEADAPAPDAIQGEATETEATETEATETEATETEATETEATETEATETEATRVVDVITPGGGESVSEGTILEWSVKVGDQITDGETLVEISTDKVDMELPAPASGTLIEILAADGETVTVGQVIARIAAEEGSRGRSARKAPPGAPAKAGAADGASSGPTVSSNASPVARRVAAAEGVDLGAVTGTARGGRIRKADVLAAGANGSATFEVAPPRSRATWRQAARFRPRPHSGRSRLPRSTHAAGSSRRPAAGSRSRT